MKRRNWPLLLSLLPLATITTSAQSIYTPYAFTNFAGAAGGSGNSDGLGPDARFNYPSDVALDGAGNLYVADSVNSTIRKITMVGGNWLVTTLAGSARDVGSVDGTNSFARFNNPTGVAVDSAGNIFV